MMKQLHLPFYFFVFLFFISFSCNRQKVDTSASEDQSESKIVKNDVSLPNGVLTKDVEYILKIDKVNFTVQAAMKKDSSVVLKFNFYQSFAFSQHLIYQRQLMEEIVKDFPVTRFKSVHLGRLIYTGDLSLAVSNEVIYAGWDGQSYPDLKLILDSSLLVKTYGDFFGEFGIRVSGTTFEKAFLTDASVINQYAKIETRPEDMPEEVLDAICWLLLAPEN